MAKKTRQGTTTASGGQAGFGFGPDLAVGCGSDELQAALTGAYRTSAQDVLSELWEADVERLCGERWKPRPRSKVTRAGWCACQIFLGGERVSLRRPRVRSVKGKEIELPTVKAAADRDLLDRAALEDVTASITTGAFPPARHSRDEIAADFVTGLSARMSAVQAIPRGNFEPGLLVASIDFPDQSFLGAVGIDEKGGRKLAGLRAGSSTNPEAVAGFLDDLVARHRRSAPPELFFVGEEPVIHDAIREHFGASAIFQRSCHEKRRRVLGLLPPSLQPSVLESLLDAYGTTDAGAAAKELEAIADSLGRNHPEAAGALTEGLPETLTLHQLGGRGGRPAAPKGRSAQPNA